MIRQPVFLYDDNFPSVSVIYIRYISDNIDSGQHGGQAEMGTEHMLVCYVDRILKLLDEHPDKSQELSLQVLVKIRPWQSRNS